MRTMLGLLEKRKLKRKKFALPSLKGKKAGPIIGILAALLVVGAVLGYFLAYLPYTRIQAKGKILMAKGQEVKAAFKENDIELVDTKLKAVDAEFASFEKEASSVYWMRFIPLAGNYVKDFKNGVEAGGHLLIAADKAVTAIKPHADLIGFKKGTDSSFSAKPAEERLQTAVLTLDQILGDVDSIAIEVDQARNKIAEIDENRYPETLNGKPLRSMIKNNKDQFSGIASLFVDAKPFIKSLPQILGADKPKTYLILFQNDKELRATGGFLTAYAVFKVDKGKFTVDLSDDIYTLDASIKAHPKAPREIATYHKNVTQLYIRDSNLSPDFPTSMKMFDDLYKLSSKSTKYDGIIAMDTHVLVGALEILGDTQARGTTFSSRIDKRCDCPQVIYTLLDEIDRPVAYLKTDRKGILGDLLLVLMQKALGFSPSQYWGRLSQLLMKDLQEKHVQFYMVDPEIQKSLEAINYAGRIRETKGDYLHISDVNFAGAKSNLYVQHFVNSEATVNDDGSIQKTVEITYKNPQAHSNCNLEDGGGLGRGGLCINATLRNWVRVYVPQGSTLVSFKGSEKKVQTYDELGKTVFEGFLGVKPEGQAKVIVTYTLPKSQILEDIKDYNLLVQKQPGTVGHEYTVTINGKTIETFPLIEDRLVTVK